MTREKPLSSEPLPAIIFQVMWFATIKLASLGYERLAISPGVLTAIIFILSNHSTVNRSTRLTWGMIGLVFGTIIESLLVIWGLICAH